MHKYVDNINMSTSLYICYDSVISMIPLVCDVLILMLQQNKHSLTMSVHPDANNLLNLVHLSIC